MSTPTHRSPSCGWPLLPTTVSTSEATTHAFALRSTIAPRCLPGCSAARPAGACGPDAELTLQNLCSPPPTAATLRAHRECVCAGAGSDDILDIVLRMIHPEAVIMSTPTFGMYSFLGKLNGISIVDVPRKAGFHVDVEGIKAAVQRFK